MRNLSSRISHCASLTPHSPALDAVRPGFDRSTVRTGVVHLGLGAFARAHLAVYLDDLIALGHTDLGVCGVSLRHDDVPRALGPQDGLYTLAVIDGDATEHRVIGSVGELVHAPSERAVVRAALAAPTTTFVTVTVTEKGYCWAPATRRLDVEHPDVRHDIALPDEPRSLPGHLVLAASDRRNHGRELTVLSLDNLPSNGRTLQAVTLDLAAAIDPSLVPWITDHVRFPCSMVDRLVPATDDDVRVPRSRLRPVSRTPGQCERSGSRSGSSSAIGPVRCHLSPMSG